MKKLFVLLFVAAAFAACGDDASKDATPEADKTENNDGGDDDGANNGGDANNGGNMNASDDAGM